MLSFIKSTVFTLLFVTYIGTILCQISNSLDVDTLEKKVHEIPGLEKFNSSELPAVEDIEKIVREKCRKISGNEEAFDSLQAQQSAFKSCIESYLNITQIQLELEEAKKTGSMDDVFGKYCKKYPEIYGCIKTLTNSIRPCLDEMENESLTKTLNITSELRDFLCFKDGDRIAMFIAEGGIECLNSQQEALQQCANKTIGKRIPKELSITTLPTFLFNQRDCSDFQEIRTCVNIELEKCKDSTPANIVDAFFKFLKKIIPCDLTVDVPKQSNVLQSTATESLSSYTLILFTFILTSFLM